MSDSLSLGNVPFDANIVLDNSSRFAEKAASDFSGGQDQMCRQCLR